MKQIKLILLIISLALAVETAGQPRESNANVWSMLSLVHFKSTYFKKYDSYFLVPQFDEDIRALEGATVTVKGYYFPADSPNEPFVLSFYPYSQCFFCGGAGPESVVEVHTKGKRPTLEMDELIRVRGTLRLNDKDLDHLNVIIYDAEILPGK